MAKCGECAFLELDHQYEACSNKFWCSNGYVNDWKSASGKACDSFCPAYSRTSGEIENAMRGISDGCFVVTMTCDLLGRQPLLDPVLKTFKDFKCNYLMKRPEFYRELLLYEDLGPAIAHKLQRQKDRSAKDLYKFFSDIKNDIDAGKKELAYKKYKSIIVTLAEGFGFKIVKREELEKLEEQGPVKTIGTLH